MKHNGHSLPYLDTQLLDLIFAHGFDDQYDGSDEETNSFIRVLNVLSHYNYQYRQEEILKCTQSWAALLDHSLQIPKVLFFTARWVSLSANFMECELKHSNPFYIASQNRNFGRSSPLSSNSKRLIEVAFPLKQTSLDSVHEKNVRHGHISTLHIWPARRPLAACRAALIATLLPDPADPEERKEILERLGGKVVRRSSARGRTAVGSRRRKRRPKGGILHWGRENGPDLEWFRQKIREAYGGRAPKVLDPFAGGGAIPLEAMRLGCETTAVDINPVAWFILKCTLEYPQKLAGQKRPLPDFVVQDREFMERVPQVAWLQRQSLGRPSWRNSALEKPPTSSCLGWRRRSAWRPTWPGTCAPGGVGS